jgi:predicted GTPase
MNRFKHKKTNMKTETKKNANETKTPEFTPEQIAQVLAAMSPEQLATAARERQQVSLAPLIAQHAETKAELDELEARIRTINPEWNPPKPVSVADKVISWMTARNQPATKAEVSTGIGKQYVSAALKKLVANGKLTLATDKYSLYLAKA